MMVVVIGGDDDISQFHKAKKLASQDSALKRIDHLNRV